MDLKSLLKLPVELKDTSPEVKSTTEIMIMFLEYIARKTPNPIDDMFVAWLKRKLDID